MSIPNIITLGRILLVPFIVWAIASSQMEIAFAIFIVAGVSDAIDGFLAKSWLYIKPVEHADTRDEATKGNRMMVARPPSRRSVPRCDCCCCCYCC